VKSIKFALLLFCLIPLFIYAQVCETPNNNRAILFQPCTWHIGNDAGPLKVLVADNQHYDYTEINNGDATLDSFCSLSGTGILQIGSHGSPKALLVEAYQFNAAGIAACTTAFNGYLSGGYTRKEIRLMLAGKPPNLVGIAITDTGISNRWADNNSILFVGACYSRFLSDDFNVREYFGYWNPTSGIFVRHDAILLFARMDGMLDSGEGRPAEDAFSGGGFTNIFGHSVNSNGRTTLAPRVIDVSPHDQYLTSGIHPGWVEFDTRMKSNDPPTVLTMEVIPPCVAVLTNQVWTNDHLLEFNIDNSGCYHDTLPLNFTVHNTLAVSNNNERELDGGNAFPGGLVSGIGPNRDDFIFKNVCSPGKSIQPLKEMETNYFMDVRFDSVDIIEDSIVVVSSSGTSQNAIFSITADSYIDTIIFLATDLTGASGVIPADSISFDPDTIYSLSPDTIGKPILLRIGIPSGQQQGDYAGKVTVDGHGTDSLTFITRVDQPPILTLSDTLVSVPVEDTVEVVVSATDPEGDSVNIDVDMYPFTSWFDEIANDSIIFYFSPDSVDSGLTFDVVFYADDGVQNVGQPVVIQVTAAGVEGEGVRHIPKCTFLALNCPNPFVSYTNISYGITNPGRVRISVFNLAGRKIAHLEDGEKESGCYTIQWDGRDMNGRRLPGGIYFYRLETPEYSATRKLILLR
jgi:hypothetical protein